MAESQVSGSDESAETETGNTPLDRLGILAMQSVPYDAQLEHIEIYTMRGLLSVLRHGPANAKEVVICVGGAMGGLLGPDGGVYHRLGRALDDHRIGALRLSYRQPNDLESCVHDTLAVIELAAMNGTERFVILGHSFGGAVAVQAAACLSKESVPGVVTFATQSGGCEPAEQLGDRDLLFFHGTNDQILPHQSSEMVRMLAGTGELVLLDGADHLLAPAGDEVLERLLSHIPAVFAAARP